MNAIVKTAAGILAVVVLAGCGKSSDGGGAPTGGAGASPKKEVIQNCGLDTMVNLAQMWAEEYRKIASGVSTEVSGGGSCRAK
ncbi:MAG: hypothetical protein V1809_12530 [Planctomycetota bacterium]